MKGRFIGECTRLICDIIEKCDESNILGVLILLDFEKAFDSVEWNFIRKSLAFLGFGPSIIHWFETFDHNSESCVLNNGHLSKRFRIERGDRQFDPLSPYLFILSVELLSAAIKFHPNINGIQIDDSEFLISQYADDSTLILEDDTLSLNHALEVVELFSTCSGLIKPKLYGLGRDGAVERNFKQINPSSEIIQVHLNYWIFNILYINQTDI
jgi:hypothetical protein